jgi:hypothetical protein
MWPIVGIPSVLNELLEEFRTCFRRVEQYHHFAEYVSGLIVLFRFSVQAINDAFTGHRHASTKHRFMKESPWKVEKVMCRMMRLVRERAGFSNPTRGALVIDDVILHHDSDTESMEQVSWIWDHNERKHVKGHVVVTAHWVIPHGHYPVAFRIKMPGGGITKQKLAYWLVKKCRRSGLMFETVIFDSWYLAPTLTEPLEKWNLHWVSRLKSNRIYLGTSGDRPIIDYFRELGPEQWETACIDGVEEIFAAKCFTLSDQKRVKVVALKAKKSEDGIILLVTNAKSWKPESIIRTYRLRNTIEAFYRDGKQNLGLESYMLRSLEGAKRHLCMGMVAFTILQLGARHPRLGRLIREHSPSVGSMCRKTVTDTARMFLLWTMKTFRAGHDAVQTIEMAFLSRTRLTKAMGST